MKPCTPIHPCHGCLDDTGCTGTLIVREGGRRVITTHDEPEEEARDSDGAWVGFIVIAAICTLAFLAHVVVRFTV